MFISNYFVTSLFEYSKDLKKIKTNKYLFFERNLNSNNLSVSLEKIFRNNSYKDNHNYLPRKLKFI